MKNLTKESFNKWHQIIRLILSSEISGNFVKIMPKLPIMPILFLVKDKTLPSDNPLRFRKNLL